MAKKPSPILRYPVAYGATVFPEGYFPRAMVVSDPWHRQALAANTATADGITAALADTGIDARGVRMTFCRVVQP